MYQMVAPARELVTVTILQFARKNKTMSNFADEMDTKFENELLDTLSKGDETIRKKIVELRTEWSKEHEVMVTKLDSGELAPRDAAQHVNDSITSLFKKLSDLVGEEAVQEFFGMTAEDNIQLVDPDVMEASENLRKNGK